MVNSLYPQTLHDPSQSENFIAQPTTTLKHKADNDKIIKRRLLFKLSAAQSLIGAFAMTIQFIYGAYYAGNETWGMWYIFGNLFLVLAGIFGMVTSIAPSLSSVVIYMVMSTIGSIICLNLLIVSSIFIATKTKVEDKSIYKFGEKQFRYDNGKIFLFSIQIVIGLIQAGVSVASSIMTIKAVCKSCIFNWYEKKSRRENGNESNIERNHGTNQVRQTQPIALTSNPVGYETIPISQIQRVSDSSDQLERGTNKFITDDVDVDEDIDYQLQYAPSAPPDNEIDMHEQY